MWILLLVIYIGPRNTVTVVGTFNSEQSCQVAGAKAVHDLDYVRTHLKFSCVSK
jgi:hypothetical protein